MDKELRSIEAAMDNRLLMPQAPKTIVHAPKRPIVHLDLGRSACRELLNSYPHIL